MVERRRAVFYHLCLEKPEIIHPTDWVLCDCSHDDADAQRTIMLRRLLGDPRDPGYRRGRFYVYLYKYVVGTSANPAGNGYTITVSTYFVNNSPIGDTFRELISFIGQATKETEPVQKGSDAGDSDVHN